jgi:hypothetical protein
VRDDYGLADVLGVHLPQGRQQLPAGRRGAFRKGRAVYVPEVVPAVTPSSPNAGASGFGRSYWKLPKNSAELVAAIRYAAGGPMSVEFDGAPLTTVTQITEKKDGSERIVHWINFKLGAPVAPAVVTAGVPAGMKVTAVELLSPDRPKMESLKFTAEGARVRFTLPALEVYHMAVMKLVK